ncbi:hypothetical protein QR556_07110 [Acinetobacter soli]|uniref:hypothetical protein n=1 Tax=Acinetobacter soli TaxID=487316 RepID=UPI002D80B315|nr:hypothetical protein [Acinetobacter soli]MEB4800731.1 hypothetical protein [Acinetobacter soli]
MIDLEKQNKEFEKWVKNECPQIQCELNSKTDDDYDSGSMSWAWASWKHKQAEIDSLKAQLAKIESGEYLVVKKEVIENWYLDEGEYVWYEKDSIDGYLEDLDNGEVLEVQRKEYVVINSNPVFATNVYEDADNIQWELFDLKEEAEKAAAHCKAMIEAAQENSHE